MKLPKRMKKLPKYEDRWDTGLFVGLVEGTNEIRVLTPNGTLKVNSVRRMPVPQRRDRELLKAIRGLPWEPVPSDAPRPVRVDRFDVEPVKGARGVWRCVVDCSSGTYIRSLAADLGTALGGGAHLRSLRRTSVGGFTLDDAGTIESPTLLPVSAAVQHLESVLVDEDTAVLVGHGRVLPLEQLQVSGGGPWAVMGEDGALLAVYESHPQGGKPTVVIPR